MKQIALPFDAEVWREIPGYEDLYAVSNRGRVKSLVKRGRFPAGFERTISTHKPTGYRYAPLTDKQGHEAKHYIHCLVMDAFNPSDDSALEINHEDGDKSNNALSNLTWMTHRANIIHARETLKSWAITQARGERAHHSNLTDEKVREIRAMWGDGMQQRQIAPLYGVSQAAISNIVRGKTWAHVE